MQAGHSVIFCMQCGHKNGENSYRCEGCGSLLHQMPPPIDSGLSSIVPYRNAKALFAYYCGVFSLIPCLGLPLGLAGVVLGILGLHYAARHPQAKGKVHAWVGVAVGGFCFSLNTFFLVLAIYGASSGY